jgi:uncharacterized Zn finger protein
MCKHIAAVLYGIGARLDRQPELLFRLHQLDENELITRASEDLPLARKGAVPGNVLRGGNLSELFGLDLTESSLATAKLSATTASKSKPGKKKRGSKPPARPGGSV